MSNSEGRRITGGGIVLVIVLMLLALRILSPGGGGEPHPMVGEPAPPIELATLDGEMFTLADHRGEDIVILDFWATWCGPCLRAMPVLMEVAEEYAGRGVALYAIDLREPPEEVRAMLAERGWEGLNVPLDSSGAIADRYGVTGIPHTVIVGRDGKVQDVHIGYSRDLKRRLTGKLDTLVAGGSLVE